MRIAAINCSYYGMKPGDVIYNLAVDKIANYHRSLGDEVYAGPWAPLQLGSAFPTSSVDKFYFSIIFTWDVPAMIRQVNMVRSWGKEVEIGGPSATFLRRYIAKHTGLEPHAGLDDRFERVPGEYQMTFTSRGCPHGCAFCGVRRVEPVAIEYDDFPLAAVVGDNNLPACSWAHQELVVDRLSAAFPRVDINSGFDVRFFEQKHYDLYKRLNIFTWRFAFDSMAVEKNVRRVAALMKSLGYDRHHVTFYCLIGYPGTTPEQAFYRLNTLIELGMNPYPMRFWPLNRMNRTYVAPGWTEDLLFRMTCYYQTPFTWMTDSFENFRPGRPPARQPRSQGALLEE